MRCGSHPARRSRATRSVRTRVLPEPALAETQDEAAGAEARTWAARASATIGARRSWWRRRRTVASRARDGRTPGPTRTRGKRRSPSRVGGVAVRPLALARQVVVVAGEAEAAGAEAGDEAVRLGLVVPDEGAEAIEQRRVGV